MSIIKYKIFTKVVELSSLTKAALELGYTQSGVSHNIKSLEKEFGFPLLIRSKAGIRLTENGELILRHMYEVLNRQHALKQVVSAINGLQAGTITVGTFTSVAIQWLPSIISEFNTRFPDIEIRVMDGVYHDIEELLASEKVECGFVTLPTHKDFQCIPLVKDRLLAVLPADYPMSDEKYFPLNFFKTTPVIIPGEGSDYEIGRIFKKAGIKPKIRFSFRDDYSAIAMVKKGLGITILPELLLQGDVHSLKIMELESHDYRTIGIATPSAKNISPAVKLFLEHTKEWVREHQKSLTIIA